MSAINNSVIEQDRILQPLRQEMVRSQAWEIASIIAMGIFGAVTVGGVALAFSCWSFIFTPVFLVTAMIALEFFVESCVVYSEINPLKNRLFQLNEDMGEISGNVDTFFEDLGNLNIAQIAYRAFNNVVQDGVLGYANRIRAVNQEYTDLVVNRALEQKRDELYQKLPAFSALLRTGGVFPRSHNAITLEDAITAQ